MYMSNVSEENTPSIAEVDNMSSIAAAESNKEATSEAMARFQGKRLFCF